MTVKQTIRVNTKKEIMKRAWVIADQAATKFGGNKSEYIAESMKMAWNESKQEKATAQSFIQKSEAAYETFIQSVVNKGAKIVKRNGTFVIMEGKGFTMKFDLYISDFQAFAKAKADNGADEQMVELKVA